MLMYNNSTVINFQIKELLPVVCNLDCYFISLIWFLFIILITFSENFPGISTKQNLSNKAISPIDFPRFLFHAIAPYDITDTYVCLLPILMNKSYHTHLLRGFWNHLFCLSAFLKSSFFFSVSVFSEVIFPELYFCFCRRFSLS